MERLPSLRDRREAGALLTAVGVAAISGLVYELLLGTTASFLLGDSITEWSLTIGTFLAAMGLGSWLSRYVGDDLVPALVGVEAGLGVFGGVSILALFGIFAWAGDVFRVCFYGVILGVGVAVGLEIPLLTRAIKRYGVLRTVLSSVLAVDYGGALLASLVYPLLLYPVLGVARTAFVAGGFNLLGAALILVAFRRHRGPSRGLWAVVGVSTVAVVAGFAVSTRLTSIIDRRLYAPEQLVYAARSPYQHIALTRGPGGTTNLYLNGHLQFHSGDEARYHESLVHVPMGLAAHRLRVLVLGGGDGVALREILKYREVRSATLVDLDARVTTLARTDPLLTAVNHHSFDDPRVHLVNGDATAWLRTHPDRRFDVILCDFPDPSNPALSRLYTVQFYRLVRQHLAAGGVMAAQAGSPYFARRAYWCIVASVRAAGLTPLPYHVNVPSFGEWGFVAGRVGPPMDPSRLRVTVPTRYLDDADLPALFVFPPDEARIPERPHTLLVPRLPRLFEEGWKQHVG